MGRPVADSEQFSIWADDHVSALVRFGCALTGDPSTAGDVVQTALARTYAAWPALARRADPELFARRVIVHALVTEVRRERGRARTAGRAEGPGSARSAVPPRRRAALVAQYCEGRSDSAAAALLGWSLGTVKQQTAAGLADLAASLPRERSGREDVVAALNAAYEQIPPDPVDTDSLIASAMNQGTARRRRELQTRVAVFVAVCVIALAGLVGLSRGGHRIPHFGGAGALIAARRVDLGEDHRVGWPRDRLALSPDLTLR